MLAALLATNSSALSSSFLDWQVSWDQVSSIQFQYPSMAWCPQPITSAAVTTPPWGWLSSWDNPSVSRHPVEGGMSWTATALPFQNPPIGWLRDWDNPVLPRVPVKDWISWQPTGLPFQNPPIGWLRAWDNPVLARAPVRDYHSWAPTSLPFQNPPFGWYVRWQDTVPRVVSFVQDWIAWDPQTPPNLPVTPANLGFWVGWENPRLPRYPVQDWLAWNPQIVSSVVVVAPPFGWFQGWPNPIPIRRPVDGATFQTLTNLPFQNPPIGWHQSWPNPVAARQLVKDWYSWAPTNKPFQNPPYGWMQPWANPTLARQPVTRDWLSWQPTNLPFQSPAFGWFSRWPDVLPAPRRAVQDWIAWTAQAITVVAAPPFGWYVRWLDPTRAASRVPADWIAWNPQIVSSAAVVAPPFGWFSLWPNPTIYVPAEQPGSGLWTPIVPIAPIIPSGTTVIADMYVKMALAFQANRYRQNPYTKKVQNFELIAAACRFSEVVSVPASGITIPLDAIGGTAYYFYVRCFGPDSLTVTYTTAEGTASVVLAAPAKRRTYGGVFVYAQPAENGGGITGITMTPGPFLSSCEYFVAA